MKKLTVIALTLLLLLIPIVPMQYKVLVERSLVEEYVTTEPYTAYDEVQVPYRTFETSVYWQESEGYRLWKEAVKTSIEDSLPSYYGLDKSLSGRWITENVGVARFRTAEEPVTRYRTVTKTRIVSRPAIEIRIRRVSTLYYIIRGGD